MSPTSSKNSYEQEYQVAGHKVQKYHGVLYIDDVEIEHYSITEQIIFKLLEEQNELLKALKEISEGKGAYSQDKLEHASNTIRDMVEIANKAIAKTEEKWYEMSSM